ncbi:hypothetical protein SAMN04487769_2984 [Burkholderia sp. b14]|nr:hypothetical protein SAMN04487768_1666 [Burkholderia sp. b13]SIT78466.1 hypothetical protein SAMN04487769_2984 [Burkholderia sp. b14]
METDGAWCHGMTRIASVKASTPHVGVYLHADCHRIPFECENGAGVCRCQAVCCAFVGRGRAGAEQSEAEVSGWHRSTREPCTRTFTAAGYEAP